MFILLAGVGEGEQYPPVAALRVRPSDFDRMASRGGQGSGSSGRKTRGESLLFSSGGNEAGGVSQNAQCLCRPSPATSELPNHDCLAHHRANDGLFHVAAAHEPIYCIGCPDSGPCPVHQTLCPSPSTTYQLEVVRPPLFRTHVSGAASRRVRIQDLHRRHALQRWNRK